MALRQASAERSGSGGATAEASRGRSSLWAEGSKLSLRRPARRTSKTILPTDLLL
jgi:hypothetical protein